MKWKRGYVWGGWCWGWTMIDAVISEKFTTMLYDVNVTSDKLHIIVQLGALYIILNQLS